MKAITTFSGLLSRSLRSSRVEVLSCVASSSSKQQFNSGTCASFTAMQVPSAHQQTGSINRNYSTSTACNARRVRWDKTIKKWDISGTGFDAFEEKKEKIDDQVLTGRAWTAPDLRRKSFDDLHKLWFVLYKERNMLLSERDKTRRLGRPQAPKDDARYMKVKRSMGAIKFVLNERSKIRKELQLTQMLESISFDSDDAAVGGVGLGLGRGDEGGATAATKGKKLADTKPGGVSK